MKTSIISVAVVAFSFVGASLGNPQARAAGPKPPDPVATFKPIVKVFSDFLAKEPSLYWSEPLPSSPSGKIFKVSKYAGDVSYDVRKTDSLVSPFTAYVAWSLVLTDNASCGDLAVGLKPAGYSTKEGSLSSAAKTECWRRTYNDDVRVKYQFNYAFQDGAWVFKGYTPAQYIFLAFTARSGFSDAPEDPLNRSWVEFFNSVMK